ncbi:MAG TPA: hypothetical protein PKL83_06220 [bacterium]|nr:hypothetical protein [bacterium]
MKQKMSWATLSLLIGLFLLVVGISCALVTDKNAVVEFFTAFGIIGGSVGIIGWPVCMMMGK